MGDAFDEALGLHRQGRFSQAEALYRAVIDQTPAHFDALHLLGIAQHQQGRHDRALDMFERAMRLRPDHAAVHSSRGAALYAMGLYEDALKSQDHAVALQPHHAEALSNRGNTLQQLARHAEALASYDETLRLAPGYAQAHANRGALLCELGRPQEALQGCDRALALEPGFAQAHYNRGNALHLLGRAQEAAASYAKAVDLSPGYAQAWFNLSNVLAQLRHYEDAVRACERVFALGRDFPCARGNLLDAKLRACDWRERDEHARALTEAVRAGQRAVMPFAFLAMSDDAADQLRCARILARHTAAAAAPLWAGERYAHDRIRVAYLCATFHDHAVARLIVGAMEAHDKSRFEITGVSFGPADAASDIRRRIERCCDAFVDARGMSDREVAQLLREREIDIAVDLDGYTAREGRPAVLALRPAPVQVNYLGYPGTMGADHIDYIVADASLVPPGDEAFYSEKVVRLPHSYQPNDRTRAVPDAPAGRAQAGLPESGFVFCCFNNNYKISPGIFSAWMRLLGQVEGSVLWLLEDSAAAARNLRQEAQLRGIDAQRLVFAPRTDHAAHLARHRLAGLFLDTPAYNAHTTASEALWAGLPVLTCPGSTFASRVGASLLRAAGLPELVAPDLEAYESLALALAREPSRLAALRERLARNRAACALFDTGRTCRHLEAAYLAMWERTRAGLAPAALDVADGA